MSAGKNKAIFRSAKLSRGRGKTSVGSSWRHQQFHDKVAEISHPELSSQNSTKLFIADYETLRKTINGSIKKHNEIVAKERDTMLAKGEKKNLPRQLRKDAAVACECIFTFSPEMAGQFDIKDWVKANMGFIKREFIDKGAIPVRMDLHMDESCPHLHLMILPITKEGKISAKEYLGGAGRLSKMQDRYAKAMEQFGLTRGYSRYNEYKSLQQQAVKHGYGSDFESVKRYCAFLGVPVPERKKHMGKREWLAKLEANIEEAKKELADIKHQIEVADKVADKKFGITLETQLKEAQQRVEYLEEFTRTPGVRDAYKAYNEVRNPNKEPINHGDDVLGDW